MKKGTFLWWVVFIALCIWQLPQLLVGLVMMLFMSGMDLVAYRHFNFCFTSSSMMGGISLGPIAFVSRRLTDPETVAHELDGHTVQSKIWGPLYLIVIGLPSLIHAWVYDPKKTCYYDYWCEKQANDYAGLTTDSSCHLVFKDKKEGSN